MCDNTVGNFYGPSLPPRVLQKNNKEYFPLIGDRWIDTTTSINYIYNNSSWKKINSYNLNMFTDLYNDVIDALVSVVYSVDANNKQTSEASGFLISTDGFIVSSAHEVLNNFPSTQNFGILNVGNIRKLYAVLYPENIMVPCDLVGVNAKADIALIKITSNVPINNKYLTFIDNNMINIGDEVFVMGSPKTSVANIQSITRGIICNNRFPSDKIIERLMADVPAIFGNSGGPLINIKGQVVGVVQGGFSTSGKLDKINNFNSVSLIKPMIDYFINNGNTGQIYPSGFFGIYGIYVNDIVSVQLRGQLLSTDPSLVQGYYINNNVVSTPLKAGTGKFEDTIVPTVYSGSPADIIGLTAGDIILSAALNNEILMPITQTQMLLGTLVTLATNTGIIDIEYIKSAENWNILHTATVQLTGVPYDYEVLNNVFI